MAGQAAAADAGGEGGGGLALDAEAFKRLCPQAFLERFVAEGLRPDGRALGRGRAVAIGAGAVGCRPGSALVKLGATTVLAGARVRVVRPEGEEGSLRWAVEAAHFASASGEAGRGRGPSELVSVCQSRLQAASEQLGLARQLCIAPGRGAYAVDADVYILCADGAVFDCVLLAAVALLRDLALPATREVGEPGTGAIVALPDHEAAAAPPVRLQLPVQPLAVTCCMYGHHVLLDPTAEEEAVAGCSVTAVVDGAGRLHGLYKPGGTLAVSPLDLVRCIEAAKLRRAELAALLDQALGEGDGTMAA